MERRRRRGPGPRALIASVAIGSLVIGGCGWNDDALETAEATTEDLLAEIARLSDDLAGLEADYAELHEQLMDREAELDACRFDG